MSLSTNANFTRLVEHLQAQGAAAQQNTASTPLYREFIEAFPLERLNQLTLDEYCVGKGDRSFSWWLEVGLTPVLGRYMPGTSRGHILYYRKDGSLYRIKNFEGWSDEDALRYTLKVQSAIAAADPKVDLRWVDDDAQIFKRAGVDQLVTVGEGRKLRLLSCYHPSDTLPISSSAHLAHFLLALGFPEADVPPFSQPVARMLLLRDYYLKACEQVPGLSTYGFMRGLYNEEVGIHPVKADQTPAEPCMEFVPIQLSHGDRLDWSRVTHLRHLGRKADTPKAQESLDFIAEHMDEDGVTAIGELEKDFPGRLRSNKGQLGGMRFDLRHFANNRASGNNPQDKGLIELGYMAPVNLTFTRPTYLLTWNPEHFKLGGDEGVTLGEEVDWSCHSRKPQPGDVVYLVRLGKEPRGIVARGLVTEGAHDAPDWKHAGKTRNYIRFSIDENRPDCASGLLPMVLLNKAISGQRWNPQSSGVEIRPALAAQLETLWQAGEGVHSLRQYVEWSKASPVESRPEWLGRYEAIVGLAKALRSGQVALDAAALERLWLDRDNGVSSLKQGVLSRAELSAQQATITELTQRILATPTGQTHQQVMQRWRQGVDSGQFKMNRPAMINRVFAAIAPESFTSLLKSEDCQRLLRGLAEQFQLPIASLDQDWCELNAQIITCMGMAGLDMGTVLPNNIAMWQLLEALQGGPGVDPIELTDAAIPLNQILFGPPGTGKTYNTVNEALRILDPELVAQPGVTREALTAAFQRYVDSGQLVFCTFHQSFSYEDFVEGLRAVPEGGQLHYKVEPGVFKRLCDEARRGEGVLSADDVLNAFLEEITETPVTLTTVRGKPFEVRYKPGNTTFTCLPKASGSALELPANIEQVRLYLKGQKPASVYCESYVRGIAEHLRGKLESGAAGKQTGLNRPHVLVIDEINRGNISRIFGELITLIEASKREGSVEALSVTLPYSKELFTVSANVYLIGTMNTADRSLAGLDIALRRRFTFVEMPPRPELLDDVFVEGLVNIGHLIRVMNQRIEVLLDREHCLGHAYFIPLKTDPSLELLGTIFRNQIMPLLQEYFFEDWERIAWVLNDQRATASMPFLRKPESELNLAALFGDDVAGKLNDQRWELNDQAFGSIDSYRNILG